MPKVTINLLTNEEQALLDKFLDQYDNGSVCRTSFPHVGSGLTARVYHLTEDKVVRIQEGFVNDYPRWVHLCTTQKSKHFPQYFYLRESGQRTVTVMEKLESLSWGQEIQWNNRYMKRWFRDESYRKSRIIGSKTLTGSATAFSRQSLLRVAKKAQAAHVSMNDCHAGNVMLRVSGGKKVLVITDPTV